MSMASMVSVWSRGNLSSSDGCWFKLTCSIWYSRHSLIFKSAWFCRVLRQGGYLVLLLSLQLSAQIKKLIKSNTLNPEPCTASRDKESHDRTHSMNAHSSKTDEHRDTERSKLSSLHLQSTHRVSLGSTDGIIHTYTKTHHLTCWNTHIQKHSLH